MRRGLVGVEIVTKGRGGAGRPSARTGALYTQADDQPEAPQTSVAKEMATDRCSLHADFALNLSARLLDRRFARQYCSESGGINRDL